MIDHNEPDRAVPLFEEALGLFRALKDQANTGMAVHNLGIAALDRGDLERAAALLREGLALFVEVGDRSGIAFGLGAALYSALSFRDGRVQESNYHDYRVLRMDEMPKIEVHIVPSTGRMGGAGEPGTPPIAPAVANAVFALTGQRLRELPLRVPASTAPATA